MRVTITETTARTCDVDLDEVADALGLSLDQVAAWPAHRLAQEVGSAPALAARFVPDGYSRTEAVDQATPTAGPRTLSAAQALDYFTEARHPGGPRAVIDPAAGERGVRCPVCDGPVTRWVVDVRPRPMLTEPTPEGTGTMVWLGGDRALRRLPDGQRIRRDTLRSEVDRCDRCGTVVQLDAAQVVTA